MPYEMIAIGYGNYIARARVVAVVTADSAPARRLVQDARDRSSLIDATGGRKTRAVIVMDSDHVVLSALEPKAVPFEDGGRSGADPADVRQRGER